MPSLAAGTEAGELGGHAAPAALHEPPAPALQRAEGSCGVHLHHVGGVRTASPQGGGISEPSSLFSEAGGTRRDGRVPARTPQGAQTKALRGRGAKAGRTWRRSHPGRVFRPQGPRNFLESESEIQQWKFRPKNSDGFSASGLWELLPHRGNRPPRRPPPRGEPRTLAWHPRPAGLPWLVSECPEPASLSLAPRASLGRAPGCPSGSCLALPARQSPSPMLHGIFQKVNPQLMRLKKKRRKPGDFWWSPRGRRPDSRRRGPKETPRRAGGPATAPVQARAGYAGGVSRALEPGGSGDS